MALLEADQLTFGYGTETLFQGRSFSFDAGELVAITGPSGRGKSTLLYLLGLMLQATGGTVRVDGVDCSQKSDAERSRLRATQFGFVFQDAVLDPSRTVLDNVLEVSLYNGASRRDAAMRAVRLLHRFGVAHRTSHRPGQVSGGQAQRIALCRALLHEPRIVLADEPTGNLDEDSTKVVFGALRDYAHDSSALVIIVTHDPALAARCDRVVQL